MANRSLAAKAERSRRQAREAAHLEYSKSGYSTARPFEAEGYKHVAPRKLSKVEWFDRSSKATVVYSPRTVTPKVTPLQAAWAEAGQFTLIRRK